MSLRCWVQTIPTIDMNTRSAAMASLNPRSLSNLVDWRDGHSGERRPVARKTDARTVSGVAEAWHRARRIQCPEHGTPGRAFPLCRLRPGALHVRDKVRQRHRMAKLLGAGGRCG